MAKLTFILAIATTVISLCNAQLYVIESGTSGKLGPMLEDDFYFCPSKFTSVGWSIQCKLDASVKGADIYVNGKKQMERYAPYLAAGNRGRMIYPLKNIKDGKLEVKCMGMDRTVHSATGKIGCSGMGNKAMDTMDADKPMPSPMAEMEKKEMMKENKMNMMKEEKENVMVTPAPGEEMTARSMPKDRDMMMKKESMVYSPEPAMPKSEMKAMTTKAPMAPKEPMTAEAPMAPKPMKIEAPMAPKDPLATSAPKSLTTKKDEEEVEQAPVMMKEEKAPMTTAAPATTSEPMMMPKKDGDYCIYKVGTSHSNQPLPAGWVKEGTAVTYKPDSNYGGVEKTGVSVLTYKFKVAYTSTYAVTLDMGTTHNTEHNDVFIRCQGGFNAMKSNGAKFTADGWVKAYHNRNGRAVQAFTKDNDAHALSTIKTFTAGMDYTCEIGARSTKTTIHGIVLFPCKDMECHTGSAVWKAGVSKCAPQ